MLKKYTIGKNKKKEQMKAKYNDNDIKKKINHHHLLMKIYKKKI